MKLVYTALCIFLYTFCVDAQQNVIIIGASAGIGKELARIFARNDYKVGLVARRIELLEQLQKELPGSYSKQIDIADTTTVHTKLQELVDEMGGLDIMVIGAGIWPEIAQGLVSPENTLLWNYEADTIDVNVKGFSAVANFAANIFLQQKSGHLVGISSVDALRGAAACPAYSASKAYVSNYLEGMRNKFIMLKVPIYVTDILPGYVATYEVQPGAYWVASAEKAATQIYEAINNKAKVAYVTKRWRLIAWLLMTMPDWLYHMIGGL
jgi:short-subunit dehydrogenase